MPVRTDRMSVKAEREMWLDQEVRPLLTGKAMTTPLEEMNLNDLTDTYQVLELLQKNVEARIKVLKDNLISTVQREGEETPKGGHKLEYNGFQMEYQKRQTSEPKQKEMIDLLGTRGVQLGEAYDEIKVLVYNSSKTDYLVDTGKISRAEVDSLRPISFAFRGQTSDEWDELFESAKKAKRRPFPAARSTR